MKKSLVALAVLGAFAGVASAQSSVTLFGIVDVDYSNVSANNNGGSTAKVNGGGSNASSRIGVKGSEDLGGGMAASFHLEGALSVDDGTAAGLQFARRSTVSLSGGFGELRVGRDYVPSFTSLVVFDPFGYIGNAGNAPLTMWNSTGAAGTAVRSSNSIGYHAPAGLGGFYGTAMFAPSETSSLVANNGNGTVTGARVGFANGPLDVAVATTTTKNNAGDRVSSNIGASYDLGVAKLMGLSYVNSTSGGAAGLKTSGLNIGATIPMGSGYIPVSFNSAHDDTAGTEKKVTALNFGYVYNLSKRTAVYAHYSSLKNSNGAALTQTGGQAVVVGADGSSTATAYQVGVRHSF